MPSLYIRVRPAHLPLHLSRLRRLADNETDPDRARSRLAGAVHNCQVFKKRAEVMASLMTVKIMKKL